MIVFVLIVVACLIIIFCICIAMYKKINELEEELVKYARHSITISSKIDQLYRRNGKS